MYQAAQNEILELTRALIAIPSCHCRPAEITHCADFIEEWLGRHDIRVTRSTTQGIPTLAVMPGDDLRCPILLNAHFDVVDADETLFTPRLEDGRLYGRGAIDDKYAVALSLVVFRDCLQALRRRGGTQADMPCGLLLSGDEEIGGSRGIGALAGRLDTDFFIVLDGGGPERIVTREKGILMIELEAQGVSAHASRPWLGANSFDMLVQDYLALKALFPDALPDQWHKTMVLSNCRAGNGCSNVVPHRASATLDIRYTELDDPDEIVATLRRHLRSSVHVKAREPMFQAAPSPYLDLLLSCCDDGKLCREHGASDARHLSGRNIPGVVWGAEGGMSQHTTAEYLVIDSLGVLYRRLMHFLEQVRLRRETPPHGNAQRN